MTLNPELDQWQPTGHAVRIEYSRAVMEQLRLAVTEGFNRILHGGVEVGGVLFGIRDEGTIRILAHRELICEYAFGPSFTLSNSDRNTLAELLRAPDTDIALQSMEPVGWYHSHTRSEIRLTQQDLEIYDQYFPESWQVALVLRPHRFDPLRAGFFFREPDGRVNAESTHQEFVVLPVSRQAAPSAAEEQHEPVSVHTAPVNAAPVDTVPLDTALTAPLRANALEFSRVRGAPQLPSRPPRASGNDSEKRPLPWVWIAASIALLAAGLFGIGKSPRNVSLRAVDIGSEQLRIDWDHAASAIKHSAGGELEIQDGAEKVRRDLSRELLLTGHVTYLRRSGDVTVRLVLRGADGATVTEVTGFSGAPVLSAAAPLPDAPPAAVSAVPVERLQPIEDTAPVPRREQEAHRVQELSKPAIEPAQLAEKAAAPVPARLRRWVAPESAAVSAAAEIPSPPAIGVSSPAPIATIIPRTPVHIAPTPPDWPASGKLIWTGKLERGGTIEILGNHASPGRLTGALPGFPVRVRIFPTELTQSGLKVFTGDERSAGVTEAPGAQNGWMPTSWVLNAKKAGDLRMLVAPAQENGWNRLSVRAERGDHTVIVMNWERLTGGQ